MSQLHRNIKFCYDTLLCRPLNEMKSFIVQYIQYLFALRHTYKSIKFPNFLSFSTESMND